ncbi:MAG: VOC family protein [Muribaculaceae bacterium]|nr:VOC family protein [Muribaculaceae bacterium]
MALKLHFDHYNINVADIDKSIDFYRRALGLDVVGRIDSSTSAFVIMYLGDGSSGFRLELTWMKDHARPYDLGENETHLALRLNAGEDYQAVYDLHKSMGVICYENPAMGVYFIEDPDGYWIEILRPKG